MREAVAGSETWLTSATRDKKKNKKRKGNKLDFDLDAVYAMPDEVEEAPAATGQPGQSAASE